MPRGARDAVSLAASPVDQATNEASREKFAARSPPMSARVTRPSWPTAGPVGVEALNGEVSEATPASKPRWYLVSTDDRMIPPPLQRRCQSEPGYRRRRGWQRLDLHRSPRQWSQSIEQAAQSGPSRPPRPCRSRSGREGRRSISRPADVEPPASLRASLRFARTPGSVRDRRPSLPPRPRSARRISPSRCASGWPKRSRARMPRWPLRPSWTARATRAASHSARLQERRPGRP